MKILIIIFLSFIMARTASYPHTDILNDSRSCGERPNLEYSIQSPSGHFIIHYDMYYDDINQYAYSVGVAADSSRYVMVDVMGFRSEIDDDDGFYDIYIEQLGNGSYGWNCLDSDNMGSSWIEIDDDYIGSGYSTSGEDAMKITVAHEFFHAIQRAYLSSNNKNKFFFELSSVWIEDIIYPDIDDYISFGQLADYYFDDPEMDIDDYYGYGLGLYGHYLNFKFDDQVMQRIWDGLSNVNPNDDSHVIQAINSTLINEEYNYNSSFIETWLDFNARNLFNGSFNDMSNDLYYYIDQSKFIPIDSNPINIEDTHNINFSLDNKSVSIESFNIESTQYFNILNNPDFHDVHGLNVVESNQLENNSINPIYSTYQSDILSFDDIVHIMYMAESERNFQATISSFFLDESDDIIVYPNPIYDEVELIVRMSPGIEVDNLFINVYDIKGHLINQLNIGKINYSYSDFNQFEINLFDTFLSSGMYILSFNLDGNIINKKIWYLK